ncbi:MAG: hypothetical protein WA761_03240, partial [Thermoplasmata archaeon]
MPVGVHAAANSSPALTPPSTRWGAMMAADPAEGYTLLFSGSSGSSTVAGTMYGDTWAFQSDAWTDLSPLLCAPATCPQARTQGGMSYYGINDSSSHGYVVLFGGRSSGSNATFLG